MNHPMDKLKEEFENHEGSIESYGLVAALEEMTPHWESHIADGEDPRIMIADLKALEEKTRDLRKALAEFMGEESEATMQVSLDGGLTFEPVTNDVRVVYRDVLVNGEDDSGQMDFVLTTEGLVTDLWVSREGKLDHNLGTSAQTIEDIQEEMVSSNQ